MRVVITGHCQGQIMSIKYAWAIDLLYKISTTSCTRNRSNGVWALGVGWRGRYKVAYHRVLLLPVIWSGDYRAVCHDERERRRLQISVLDITDRLLASRYRLDHRCRIYFNAHLVNKSFSAQALTGLNFGLYDWACATGRATT